MAGGKNDQFHALCEEILVDVAKLFILYLQRGYFYSVEARCEHQLLNGSCSIIPVDKTWLRKSEQLKHLFAVGSLFYDTASGIWLFLWRQIYSTQKNDLFLGLTFRYMKVGPVFNLFLPYLLPDSIWICRSQMKWSTSGSPLCHRSFINKVNKDVRSTFQIKHAYLLSTCC